ncbi:MAG: tRNA (adenosine(37)-N6)-dimethylallyltransferase MiaA, partial [Planctomycetes bacterium]|nr:tRNA (adenosine(37)-N6)-dimethylallyltransferase MiaA [Planctomycetota bacterium]
MVAEDRELGPLHDRRQRLARLRPVPDDVAEADDPLAAEALDLLQADRQRLHVAVDVREEGDHGLAGDGGYVAARRRGRAEPLTSPTALAAAPPLEPLLVVTGPTASGKTAFALELAARTGREILSMDSMAVYRRMDIGTAKPSAADRARAPHHLIDLVEPHEDFDTARWCAAAADALADLGRRGKGALFVGGTPLYLMAFFKGMLESPPGDPKLRADLAAREAAEPGVLHAELLQRDPAAAARIHPKDLRRLVRAHEV